MNASPKLSFIVLVLVVCAVIAVTIVARQSRAPEPVVAQTPSPEPAAEELQTAPAPQLDFDADIWLANRRADQQQQDITKAVEKVLEKRLWSFETEQAFKAAAYERRVAELEGEVRTLNERVVRNAYELQELRDALRKARARAVFGLPE